MPFRALLLSTLLAADLSPVSLNTLATLLDDLLRLQVPPAALPVTATQCWLCSNWLDEMNATPATTRKVELASHQRDNVARLLSFNTKSDEIKSLLDLCKVQYGILKH